jgi:hypothetical protein
MSATASSGSPGGMSWNPDTGKISFEFWEAQREALDAFMSGEYDITAFLGGFGSGKTTTGARLIITLAQASPGSKHAAMAIDFQKGNETTFEELFKNLPGQRTHILTSNFNGPEQSPIVADYNRNDHRLTFTNDSIIRLASADHPQSVIGDEFQSVWLDEPSKYHPSEKLYEIALDVVPSRLRSFEPQYGQFWSLTGNGYNAAYRILQERVNASGEELGTEIFVKRASMLNNPYLSDAVKERQRRQYSGTSVEEQALHGGFAAAEGLVYDLNREEHIRPLDIHQTNNERHIAVDLWDGRTVPVDPEYRIYGYDHGWHPDPRAALEIGRTVGENRLVVLDEFIRTKSPLPETMRWLAPKPGGVIASEHMPEDIEELNSGDEDAPQYDPREFEAIEANKSLDAGIPKVSSWLNPRDENGEPLPPELLIADRCEELINEFFSYKQEDIGGKSADDHLLDCLRYAVMAVEDGNDVPSSMGFGSIKL